MLNIFTFNNEKMRRVFITPTIAQNYLNRSIHNNRFLNYRRIEKYARIMSSGMWRICAQPIQFDINGNMYDGQHRCYGCIRAHELNPDFEGFWGWLATEHPVETVEVNDTGGIKTAANIFDMSIGKEGVNTIRGQLCRLLYYYNNEIFDKIEEIEVGEHELLTVYNNSPKDIDAAVIFGKSCQKDFGSPAVFGFAYWMLSRMSEGTEFMEKLRTGIDLVEGDPIHTFRRSYLNRRINKAGGPIWRPALLDAMFRSYTDWYNRAQSKARYNFSRGRFATFRRGFYSAVDSDILIGLTLPVAAADLRARISKVNTGKEHTI